MSHKVIFKCFCGCLCVTGFNEIKFFKINIIDLDVPGFALANYKGP